MSRQSRENGVVSRVESMEPRRLLSAGSPDYSFGFFGHTQTDFTGHGRVRQCGGGSAQWEDRAAVGETDAGKWRHRIRTHPLQQQRHVSTTQLRRRREGAFIRSSRTGNFTTASPLPSRLQPDGKIVIAGDVAINVNQGINAIGVVRFNANGTNRHPHSPRSRISIRGDCRPRTVTMSRPSWCRRTEISWSAVTSA